MTLRSRLAKLEGKPSKLALGPSVIFLCSGETGEPLAALLMGGATLTREEGETAEAFAARAEAGAGGAIFLPDNGRDALPTGKARRGTSGALWARALHENQPPA